MSLMRTWKRGNSVLLLELSHFEVRLIAADQSFPMGERVVFSEKVSQKQAVALVGVLEKVGRDSNVASYVSFPRKAYIRASEYTGKTRSRKNQKGRYSLTFGRDGDRHVVLELQASDAAELRVLIAGFFGMSNTSFL